jgi:PAS domain S-box-containing protein/putative nucleotidyltransferase with HDIG domain
VSETIRVLIVEDLPTDAELCEREVKNALKDCRFLRVETRRDYLAALQAFKPDIIISDFKLPAFDGMSALKLALEICPEIPFILLTGSMNEDTAVECMKTGAWDYVIKEHVKRLGSVVLNMLEEKRLRIDKRRADEALKVSEERYRRISSVTSDVAYSCVAGQDGDYTLDWLSGATEQMTGYSDDEIMARSCWGFMVIDEDRPIFDRHVTGLKPGQADSCELRLIHKSGKTIWVTSMTECVAEKNSPGMPRIYGGLTDITGRKQTEEAILRSKILLQDVIDATPDWIYVKDSEHRYKLVNKSFAQSQNILPQDMAGRCDTDFFPAELCFGDPDRGIAGFHNDDNRALEGSVVHNPRNIIAWADGSWHIYDTYKIPLHDHASKIYGVLVYSRDITERQAAEDDREAAYNKLQKTLSDFIGTMSKIVEMRDPYTAGHQTRVAGLSVAIATELGLPDEQVKYIRVAALIHDIGKMYVPSDILSKPGKLSDIEWQLIKMHAQGSYDILSTIEFPWPVADVVLQHHERINGSGYPGGLTGNKITLEAKIIAVADVIEAMASHRPYRQSLGIQAALKEIEQKRGELYDPAVVDACVKLFSEGKFQLQ